jgi:hypothetical protein
LWTETVEQKYIVEDPGDWEALPSGHLVGIRKCETALQSVENPRHHLITGSELRRRGGFERQLSHSAPKEGDDDWEVWSISSRGERTTIPLSGLGHDHLLVGGLGPLEKIGKRSLAVGLGNVVKIITVGKEKFDSLDSGSDDGTFVGMTASRRKKSNVSRKRSS